MNVRAIKTEESRLAVERIKKSISKHFNIGYSQSIPKEFIEKRNYMQSDEFIKDPDNQRMFSFAEHIGKKN